MPECALDGITMHYERGGDGPPMLLLAGMLSDSASWAPLLPLLEPHLDLIRPDNRATGRTGPKDAPISLDLMAQDILNLMDALELGSAHVLGHSMGGFLALRLSQLAPERARSITMLASAPIPMNRNAEMFRIMCKLRAQDTDSADWLRVLFAHIFKPSFFSDPANVIAAASASLAYPHAQSLEAMRHQVAAFAQMDTTALAPPDNVPAHAILGELDGPIPLPLARAVLEPLMPVQVIGNAAHSVHWEAPNPVADLILPFIQSCEAQA